MSCHTLGRAATCLGCLIALVGGVLLATRSTVRLEGLGSVLSRQGVEMRSGATALLGGLPSGEYCREHGVGIVTGLLLKAEPFGGAERVENIVAGTEGGTALHARLVSVQGKDHVVSESEATEWALVHRWDGLLLRPRDLPGNAGSPSVRVVLDSVPAEFVGQQALAVAIIVGDERALSRALTDGVEALGVLAAGIVIGVLGLLLAGRSRRATAVLSDRCHVCVR